jgi:hypothetical protein
MALSVVPCTNIIVANGILVAPNTNIMGTNGTCSCSLHYYHREWNKWHFCAFGNLLEAGLDLYDSVRSKSKCTTLTIFERL